MTWVEELDARIRRNWRVGEIFTIEDVYEWVAEFERAHPQNRHVPATMRDTLQILRDEGQIEFRGEKGDPEAGSYKRLA